MGAFPKAALLVWSSSLRCMPLGVGIWNHLLIFLTNSMLIISSAPPVTSTLYWLLPNILYPMFMPWNRRPLQVRSWKTRTPQQTYHAVTSCCARRTSVPTSHVVVVVRMIEETRVCPCAYLRAVNSKATLEPVLHLAESVRNLPCSDRSLVTDRLINQPPNARKKKRWRAIFIPNKQKERERRETAKVGMTVKVGQSERDGQKVEVGTRQAKVGSNKGQQE